jgi:hypothetical protein
MATTTVNNNISTGPSSPISSNKTHSTLNSGINTSNMNNNLNNGKLNHTNSSGSIQTNTGFTFSLETPSLSSGTLDKYLKSVLGSDSTNTIHSEILKTNTTINNNENVNSFPHGGDSKETVSNIENQVPISSSNSVDPVSNNNNTNSTTTNSTTTTPSNNLNQTQTPSNQLATTESGNNEVIPIPRGQSYVDITEYLNMPQADAAKKLGIPPSTLSKRWKEAVRKRKWPYRMICKIDKEIMTLLHNVPQGPNAPPLPEEIETALGHLLRKRQEELRSVVIRI